MILPDCTYHSLRDFLITQKTLQSRVAQFTGIKSVPVKTHTPNVIPNGKGKHTDSIATPAETQGSNVDNVKTKVKKIVQNTSKSFLMSTTTKPSPTWSLVTKAAIAIFTEPTANTIFFNATYSQTSKRKIQPPPPPLSHLSLKHCRIFLKETARHSQRRPLQKRLALRPPLLILKLRG